ncbi:hypothetical protein Trydic_g3851 [Trypoxylus dichotomus]
MVIDSDVLDDFTTQLMQRKTDKWENLKIKRQFPLAVQSEPVNKALLRCRLSRITMTELNEIFEKFLDESDQQKLVTLIEECIPYKMSPSDMILTNMLTLFAQTSNIDGINKIQELCSITNLGFLRVNSNFNHYIAEAIWLKGNVSRAIAMYEEVYQENPFLRRRIRLVLKYLILEAVSNRSEAVLVNLVSFCERLARKYKDYFIMSCLWQTCFLSEWFSDQQVAFGLIERNGNLCRVLAPQIPLVVSISLRHHRTDPIFRLLEVLLKCQMKMQSSIVLIALFDYRFKQGDLRSCCEILNWSTKHQIMLPSIQHEKFLKLLLKEDEAVDKKDSPIPTPKYELIF